MANAGLIGIKDDLQEALDQIISAYGRRSTHTSELLPPEQQPDEIANGMRALAKVRGES